MKYFEYLDHNIIIYEAIFLLVKYHFNKIKSTLKFLDFIHFF